MLNVCLKFIVFAKSLCTTFVFLLNPCTTPLRQSFTQRGHGEPCAGPGEDAVPTQGRTLGTIPRPISRRARCWAVPPELPRGPEPAHGPLELAHTTAGRSMTSRGRFCDPPTVGERKFRGGLRPRMDGPFARSSIPKYHPLDPPPSLASPVPCAFPYAENGPKRVCVKFWLVPVVPVTGIEF